MIPGEWEPRRSRALRAQTMAPYEQRSTTLSAGGSGSARPNLRATYGSPESRFSVRLPLLVGVLLVSLFILMWQAASIGR